MILSIKNIGKSSWGYQDIKTHSKWSITKNEILNEWNSFCNSVFLEFISGIFTKWLSKFVSLYLLVIENINKGCNPDSIKRKQSDYTETHGTYCLYSCCFSGNSFKINLYNMSNTITRLVIRISFLYSNRKYQEKCHLTFPRTRVKLTVRCLWKQKNSGTRGITSPGRYLELLEVR